MKDFHYSVGYNGASVADAQDKADDCAPLHKDCFLCDLFDAGSDVLSNIKLFPAVVMEFLEQLNICKSCGPDSNISSVERVCKSHLVSYGSGCFRKNVEGG